MESTGEFSPKEQSCFPVAVDTLNTVQQEITTQFGGDRQRFVEHEREKIDENLQSLIDTAYGWYEERTQDKDKYDRQDRDAFWEGSAIVHRALRAQGIVPAISDETAQLNPIVDTYKEAADAKEISEGRFLASPETPKFSLMKGLDQSDKAFAQGLDRLHLSPSAAIGAEVTYMVLRNAHDNPQAESHNLDAELERLIQGE